VEAHLATSDPETVYDTLMLPALAYARRDASELSDQQEQDVLRGTAAILDDLGPIGLGSAPSNPGQGVSVCVLGCPAGSETDEIALEMLRRVLDATRFVVEAASTRMLSSEVVATVRERSYAAACIVALPPGGVPHAKYLCKKLRATFPDLKILVGRWGPPGLGGEGAETLVASGADAVGSTLLETRDQLSQLVLRLTDSASPTADRAAASPAIRTAAP